MAGKFDQYGDSGGEHKPLKREDLEELIGRMATGEDGFGDAGGELARLRRPLRPSDFGHAALNPPTAESILELT